MMRRGLSREDALTRVGAGWRPHLAQLLDDLLALDPASAVWRVEASARLEVRVVVGARARAEAARLVRECARRCQSLCEVCGEAGRPRGGAWGGVRCAGCL